MRKHLLLALAASSLMAPALALAAPDPTPQLRDAALKDDVAWDIAEDLTTEIGPRLAGTEAEARARDWAVKKLKALGFKNVRVEPFPLSVWVRGAETAEITAPFPQKLVITALGRSAATPESGLDAEVVYFPSYEALEAAPDGSLAGKIVFLSHAMKPTQDGSGYGYYGRARFTGANLAAKKGAAAIVIRSIGTDAHRNPHTGGTNFEAGVTPIPAAALSNPDADNLERMFARSKAIRMKLVLTPRQLGTGQSGNVIAEVPGTDPGAGIVLIGGHLDSWDLGTGAIDNAAGVAITAAAAKRIMDAGKPKRTIRLVWFGAEEVGAHGGRAYLAAHKDEHHAIGSESDFGADRIWRFNVKLPEHAKPVADRLATALFPLGITRGSGAASGGADVGQTIAAGASAIDLDQDGSHYFDLHHTPDDTLDKIDPEALRQNVAAWTVMLSIVANAPENISFTTP